jgi:hypothetical protein
MTLVLSVSIFIWLAAHQPRMRSVSVIRGVQLAAGLTLRKTLLWSANIYLEGVIDLHSHL